METELVVFMYSSGDGEGWIQTDRPARFGLVQQNLKFLLHWIKVDSELENSKSHTTFEEQGGNHSALKVDKLLTSLLR